MFEITLGWSLMFGISMLISTLQIYLMYRRIDIMIERTERNMHERHSAWQSIHAEEFVKLENKVSELSTQLQKSR